MNLHQAIAYGQQILSHIDNAQWNAERLLLLILKIDRAHLYTDWQRELSDVQLSEYETLLQKRADHYPLAYLEGTQEFFGRTFRVNPSVLIPRPETEEIIRAALQLSLPQSPRIIDLGAGSGCLALTLAHELPDSTVFALEYSPDALSVLHENAGKDALIVRGNLYITPFLPDSFDLVVSNPPYVEQDTELPPETKWEPTLALVTGSLEQIYDTLLHQTLRILKPGGYLIVEFGFEQQDRIKQIIATHSEFHLLEIRPDFRNLPRTFILQKRL